LYTLGRWDEALRAANGSRMLPAIDGYAAGPALYLGLVDASVTTADLLGIDLPEQEMHVVLPADHPHPPGDTITSRELAALDLIVTPPGTETRAAVDDVCTALGVAPRIAVETAHRAMIVPLVLAGVGASVLPASMARDAALRGARMVSHR
ncbi:LysR family transcriptional regulator substrate-binding protein, partial [Streptomyces sp. WM6386]|uniref:LysR family transcriptional regulator substrate-binding protein n=1 Tax=Streptomyces sp. WM6386 TaxID=1415558 RepID=UPI001901EA52